jgi:hypothetical protein
MTPGSADSSERLELSPESDPATDRIRREGYGRRPGVRQSEEPKQEGESKPDFLTRFMEQPRWEQYATAASLACLLGWLGASGWARLFAFGEAGGWFFTFTLFGCLAVVILSVAGTIPPRWTGMRERTRRHVLVGFAMLPALGGAIELLQNFWGAVAFVAAAGMAYAAYRLVTEPDDEPGGGQ